MSDRFYAPEPITADCITLGGQEAHHLLHVMRAKVGESITLFDGSGAEFQAEIVRCGRSEIDARVLQRREIDRELPFELTVGVSLPKGDRQKWLVEKLTELGVTRLVPIVTERGVAQPTDSALERLGRSVVEAAKQCGRNRLMQIDPAQAWDEWLRHGNDVAASLRLVAHPSGAPLSTLNLSDNVPTYIAIGPEGGFTDAEIAAAIAQRWQSVRLGRSILRIETAAVALAAMIVSRSS